MSTEAKVGGFTILGICILVGIIVYLSGFKFGQDNNYKFNILYGQVTGLKIGANVSYAGVKTGKVTDIKVYDTKVMVTVEINDGRKIPKNSMFTINSEGLMGEKYVSILPPGEINGYIQPNDTVVGVDEKGLDYVLQEAGSTMVQVQELMKSMNEVMGNKDVQQAMIKTAMNLQELTTNMNQMMAVMARVSTANEGNVDALIRDMSIAMANLKNSSIQVEKMLNNISPVISDPKTAQSLRSVINAAGALSQKAENTMTKLKDIKTKGSASVYYGNVGKKMSVDADLKVYNEENKFLKLGGNDIGGNDTTTNLQIGETNGKFTSRAGLINSKLGVGIDYDTGNRSAISAEVYNPNEPTIDIKGKYPINDDTYFVGKIKAVNKRDERVTYMGVQHEF